MKTLLLSAGFCSFPAVVGNRVCEARFAMIASPLLFPQFSNIKRTSLLSQRGGRGGRRIFLSAIIGRVGNTCRRVMSHFYSELRMGSVEVSAEAEGREEAPLALKNANERSLNGGS